MLIARTWPVPWLVSVIFALGIAFPALSTTVPSIRAYMFCAWPMIGRENKITRRTKNLRADNINILLKFQCLGECPVSDSLIRSCACFFVRTISPWFSAYTYPRIPPSKRFLVKKNRDKDNQILSGLSRTKVISPWNVFPSTGNPSTGTDCANLKSAWHDRIGRRPIFRAAFQRSGIAACAWLP